MGFEKEKMKQIRELILFLAVIILAILHSDKVFIIVAILFGIIKPFLIGGAIAFIINIPMAFFERKLFQKKTGEKIQSFKRIFSIILTLISIIAVIALVTTLVIPQLIRTLADLGHIIPQSMNRFLRWLETIFAENPQIMDELEKLEIQSMDWSTIFSNVLSFMKNGIGNIVNSTVSVTTTFVGAITESVISFVFGIYILIQKEKLGEQFHKALYAYLPEKVCHKTCKIIKTLEQNFHSFITGQCTEAVILGTMFVVSMTILNLPYAILVGVLIAFTALIPIVGAFIGCFVGAFLILMLSPVKAGIFLILFLVLQQIEGNLIYPRVVGSSVGLPSIWVLAAVSIGGSLMGIMGMLIFIPLVSTCYSLIRENVNWRINKKKKKEQEEAEKQD